MIEISGPDKQNVLDAISKKHRIAGNPKEVIRTYVHLFACKKAELVGDTLVINTHSELLDAKILTKTAIIMDLDATVVVV